MANYMGYTRTNYFKVTDEEKLRDLVDRIVWDDDVSVFFSQRDGEFAFGADGSIVALRNEDEEGQSDDLDYNLDVLYEALRAIVDSNYAIIITEVGHEKLRYLSADSVIIAKHGVEYIDLWSEAEAKARDLIGWDYVRTANSY